MFDSFVSKWDTAVKQVHSEAKAIRTAARAAKTAKRKQLLQDAVKSKQLARIVNQQQQQSQSQQQQQQKIRSGQSSANGIARPLPSRGIDSRHPSSSSSSSSRPPHSAFRSLALEEDLSSDPHRQQQLEAEMDVETEAEMELEGLGSEGEGMDTGGSGDEEDSKRPHSTSTPTPSSSTSLVLARPKAMNPVLFELHDPQIHVLDSGSGGFSIPRILQVLGVKGVEREVIPGATHQIALALQHLLDAARSVSHVIDKTMD